MVYPGVCRRAYTPGGGVPPYTPGGAYREIYTLGHPPREACWCMYHCLHTHPGRHAGVCTTVSHPPREACWVCNTVSHPPREACWVCYTVIHPPREACWVIHLLYTTQGGILDYTTLCTPLLREAYWAIPPYVYTLQGGILGYTHHV